MSLHIYNSLTRKLEKFLPIVEGKVSMYVCGMTVYDFCHLGHARSMIAFDVVQRWLKILGFNVNYVRNITDIDDKIIKRAIENNESIKDLTDRMIKYLHEDSDALGIERPNHEPRATEFIPQMLEIIEGLVEKNLAYQSKNGDINYSVKNFKDYGKLSGKNLEQLRAGERVNIQEDKKDPMDFVLWKSAKEEEPAEVKWRSKFGLGRPGWHIECSAMSSQLLGKTFDIHGGGADLQFPHHENEIAQSEGLNEVPLAKYWLHNGFINVDNEKMSKSLGNFFTIREILKKYPAEVVRFFIIRSHYRSPLNYSDSHLDDAWQGLKRLYTSLENFKNLEILENKKIEKIDWNNFYAKKFQSAMNNDFSTPEAVAVLFELASEINKTKSLELAKILRSLGSFLGLLQQRIFFKLGNNLDEKFIQSKINERTEAKKSKNWILADKIREELANQGIILKDSLTGTTWES